MKQTIKYALINSIATAVYIVLVVSFVFTVTQRFGGDNETIFIPMFMLMLFVLSAAVTGGLVFGRPVMWYVNGRKKEALELFFYTISIFFVITAIMFIVMIVSIR